MVTDFYGYSCKSPRKPWISNCYLDNAFIGLDYIIGPLKKSSMFFDSNRFFEFPQNPANVTSLMQTGYAYIPLACEKKECPVHMVYHGC